ncbi:MAG TPA: aspartyl/glutamyl-tRNA amidotransferase subunit C [Candidatus Paceibacterota bacterium]
MTDLSTIKKLTALARVEVGDEELKELEREIPAILKFVETISVLPVGELKRNHAGIHNVMREDSEPHESGIHTEKLLNAAPVSKEKRIVVKQVISKQRTK